MKQLAKWVLILWSVFCLVGVVWGVVAVGSSLDQKADSTRTGAAALGMGCGMAMWVGIWAAIALPALVIFLVSGRKEPVQVMVLPTVAIPVALSPPPPPRPAALCKECGKYYAGQPTFCPSCGKPVAQEDRSTDGHARLHGGAGG